ncbi:type II secretion system protein GspK [Paraglaciecola aquimarina]|uniref:Type II secretion system protein GspK n=1 Tax=Paraglaciecola algarum TaxID=3050085 RepID=A0ABS9D6Z3_9ALTE|nr:type II secretion system protein GspK [Paraglaciecola sp. G1-23]MCF2948439.1 type II secretion system protein GspK [Paraglaciecola sp. G1-23]
MGSHKGAALIIVLMLTAVISVFMMTLLGSSRMSLDVAVSINRNLMNQLEFESVKSKLLMEMYTTSFHLIGPSTAFVYDEEQPSKANLFGRPFVFSQHNIEIQDQTGLVSLQPFDKDALNALLAHYEVDEEQRIVISEQIEDWIDDDKFVRLQGAENGDYEQAFLPNNKAFQSVLELSLIPAISMELYDRISADFSLISDFSLVESFVPDYLVDLVSDSQDVDLFVEQRSGSVNLEVRGIDEGGYPSGYFDISITGEEKVNSKLTFTIIRSLGSIKPFYVINEEYN